jgi:hypothetical protein
MLEPTLLRDLTKAAAAPSNNCLHSSSWTHAHYARTHTSHIHYTSRQPAIITPQFQATPSHAKPHNTITNPCAACRLHQHGSHTSLDEHQQLFSSSTSTDPGAALSERSTGADSGLGSCGPAGLANSSSNSLDQLGAEQPSRTLFVKNVGSTVPDDDILALFQVSRLL